jgi:hypothetical protein
MSLGIGPRTSIAERPHLVSLLGPGALVPDGEGGWTETPVPLDPPRWYCQIRPATVRDLESLTVSTIVAQATYVLTGPYHPGITTQTTIQFRARTFYVNDVQTPDELEAETVAFCTEQKP